MAQLTAGYLYPRNLILVDGRRTVNGSANTTGVDVSQFKGNGVTFIFYTDTVTASGNVTATVQHSDDNSSYSALATSYAQTITATGVVLLFVPNVSKKWVRLAWAVNSGTSTNTTTLLFGSPDVATTSGGYTNAPAA